MNLSTKFAALFSISAAVAQTTTPDDESMLLIQSLGLQDELPKPGYNMEGGSVFDNYVKARRDGQFFLLGELLSKYEKPSSEPVELSVLQWCSNLHFTGSNGTSTTRGVGYTAQCVAAFLGASHSKLEAEGGQITHAVTSDEFGASEVLSASYNTQANMFTITYHNNNDNAVLLFSDTGLSTMPLNGWETHDEGDLSPNADTSSWSGTGQVTWISTEEAAALLNNDAADFTPESFDEIYEKVWNDHHAATSTGGESTNEEDDEEESTDTNTDTDADEGDENGSNTEDSMTAAEDTEEEGSESDTEEEEDDESSASGGRRLFVAIASMFSTLLGSSV